MRELLSKVGWGAVAVAALLTLWVIRAERRAGDDAADIRAAAQFLSTTKSYKARQATLAALAQRAQGRATVAIAADHAKDSQVRRLQTQLAIDSTLRDSVGTLAQLVDTVTAQRDSARSAVAGLYLRVVADSTRASLAERRADSLDAHLRRVLVIADCRMFGVSFAPRCPSRTTSLVLGVAGGAAAVLVLR